MSQAVLEGRSNGPYAYATITSSGSIAYARGAMATVLPGATATVGLADGLDMTVGDGAYVRATGGGGLCQIYGGAATIEATNCGIVAVTASGGFGRIEGSNGYVYASASGATVIASATDAYAAAEGGAVASMTGYGGQCSLGCESMVPHFSGLVVTDIVRWGNVYYRRYFSIHVLLRSSIGRYSGRRRE